MSHPQRNWTVVTGSTGGIGVEISKGLAARGHALVLVNRDAKASQAQRQALLEEHPSLPIERVTADFMATAEIASAIEHISALPGQVDALYNVAGLLSTKKVMSAEGFESHFAVNTLAPYLLTKGLRQKMSRPAHERAAMVVNFSSSAINQQKVLDLDSLVNPGEVTGLMGTYAQTKLALTALSAGMAEDLKSDNVLIRALDPGATKTSMTTDNTAMPKVLSWLVPLFFSPPDKQAAKVMVAADPDALRGRTGILVANLKEKKLPKAIADPTTQRKLIDLLETTLRASSELS
ncbi:MAG: SDR family NAD(P)-dependent oxidoreductase [Myxococcota bacterium]